MTKEEEFDIRERVKYGKEWDWKETKDWMKEARDSAIAEFGRTDEDYKEFKRAEFASLEESIAINIFAISEEYSARAYRGHSLLRYFQKDDRKLAKKLRSKMEKISGNKDVIEMQCVPIFTRMDDYLTEKKKGEKATGKIFVFRVKDKNGNPIWLDCQLRKYTTWKKYLDGNKSPQCIMCYPKDGFILKQSSGKAKNEASDVQFGEPPSCNLRKRLKGFVDKVVMYATPLVAVASLCCPATWGYTAYALGAASTGLFYYSLAAQGLNLIDQVNYGEDFGASLMTFITSIGTLILNKSLSVYLRSVATQARALSTLERIVITGLLVGLKVSQISSFVWMAISLACKPKLEPMDIIGFAVSCHNMYSCVMSPWSAEAMLTKVKAEMQAEHMKAVGKNQKEMRKENEKIEADQARLDGLRANGGDPAAIEELERKIQTAQEKVRNLEEKTFKHQEDFLDNKSKWMKDDGAREEFDKFRENAMNDPEQRGQNSRIDQNGRIIKAVTYMDAEMVFKMVSITGSKIKFANGETMDLLVNSQLKVHPRALDQMNRISTRTKSEPNDLKRMMELTKGYTDITNDQIDADRTRLADLRANDGDPAVIQQLEQRIQMAVEVAREGALPNYLKDIKLCLKDYQMITQIEIQKVKEVINSRTENEDLRRRFAQMSPGDAYRMRTVLEQSDPRALDLAYRMGTAYENNNNPVSTSRLAAWVEITQQELKNFPHNPGLPGSRKDQFFASLEGEAAFNTKMNTITEGINRAAEIARTEELTIPDAVCAYYHVEKHGDHSGEYFNETHGWNIPQEERREQYFKQEKNFIFQDGHMKDKFISQDGSQTSTIYRDGRGYSGFMKCPYDAHLGREAGQPIVASHFPAVARKN